MKACVSIWEEKSLELIQTKFNWKAIAEYYIEKYKETHGKTDRS